MTKLEKTVGVINFLNIIPWLTISIMLLFAVGMICTAGMSKEKLNLFECIKPFVMLALGVIPLVVFVRRAISIRKTHEVKTAHATSAWAITCAIVGVIFWSIVCWQMVPNTAPVIVRSFYGYPYKDVGLLDQLLPVGVLLSFFAPILLVPYYAILSYLRIKNRRVCQNFENCLLSEIRQK